MERIVSGKVDRTHRPVDSIVIWCFDPRFTESLNLFTSKYLKLKPDQFDAVTVAGGAKGLGNPENGHEHQFLANQIVISLTKHHARRISLMVHADCAMYGNLTFPNPNEEKKFYARELRLAEEAVQRLLVENQLQAEIIKVIADFDGLYRVME